MTPQLLCVPELCCWFACISQFSGWTQCTPELPISCLHPSPSLVLVLSGFWIPGFLFHSEAREEVACSTGAQGWPGAGTAHCSDQAQLLASLRPAEQGS